MARRPRIVTTADMQAAAKGAPPVALVNETLAQRLFPAADPAGRRIGLGRPRPGKPERLMTIVGVVADTKMYGLAAKAHMEVYLPYRQEAASGMALVVKLTGDPAALTSAIRRVVASTDKD